MCSPRSHRTRVLAFLAVLTILFAGLLPASSIAAPADRPAEQAACQCVTYVVNKLFGGPRPGDWPTAASMSTENYWGNKDVVGPNNMRERTRNARPGDVIIMQPNATVWAWNQSTQNGEKLTSIGDGAGHIGFILSAQYDGRMKGWYIKMRSANWPGKWAVQTLSENGCSNVADHWIFVPNGPLVTFWHPLGFA